MIRFFGILGLIALCAGLIFTVSGFAGDPAGGLKPLQKLEPGEDEKGKSKAPPKLEPLDPNVTPDPQGDDEKKPKLPDLAKPNDFEKQEDPKVVIARVAKNMEASEGRLKKGDTKKETQSIQKKIVDDLNKLINQQQQQQQQQNKDCKECSAGQKNSSSNPQQAQNSGKANKNNEAKKNEGKGAGQNSTKKNQKLNNANQPNTTKKHPGKQKKSGKTTPMKNKKSSKLPQAAKKGSDKGKDGKKLEVSKIDADKKLNGKDTTKISDLFPEKEVWGHLPKAKRQEMDAYSNEQFMPQYDQLLRQYYRVIAEHNRR